MSYTWYDFSLNENAFKHAYKAYLWTCLNCSSSHNKYSVQLKMWTENDMFF